MELLILCVLAELSLGTVRSVLKDTHLDTNIHLEKLKRSSQVTHPLELRQENSNEINTLYIYDVHVVTLVC